METTFHNVTITIEAKDAKEAYAKLCEMFYFLNRKGELEYTTDTYTTDTGHHEDERSIQELWPRPPYPEFCRQKEQCAGLSSCPRDPNCCE